MITFSCLACHKGIKARDELSGKKVKCPKCGKPTLVPVAETSPAPRGAASELPDLPTRPPVDRADSEPSEAATVPPAEKTFGPRAKLPPNTVVAGSEADSAPPSDAPDEGELTEFLAPPERDDEIGRLGPYRVLKILGSGGMGVVFKAEDPKLERAVALKAMLPSLAASNSAKKRFLREAKTAATIKHDNIVHIYQVGEDRGAPFIAMEFLEGESLDARLKREGRLDQAETMRIGREVAEGLDAAHERGLIHRDIKPANIWLASPGRKSGECRVKILDFGLAREVSDQAHLTQTGAVIGTPAYMAPEQAGGQSVDHRCDLFSLGCVLYRMCTGEMPFKGRDTMTILCALAMDNPPPPAEICGDVPNELSDLVMALLAKKPADRLGSAQEVIAALTDMAEESPAKTKTRRTAKMHRPERTGKTRIGGGGKTQLGAEPAKSSRRWLWLGAAAGVVTAVGLAILGFVLLSPRDANSGATPPLPSSPDQKAPDPVFANPLDRFDPTKIPDDERETDQPNNLVAVLGTRHMLHHWVDVRGARFSPDGKLLASFDAAGVVHVWDVATLREKSAIRGQSVDAAWFTSNDKLLAGGLTGGIQLYDVSGPEPKVATRIADKMSLLAVSEDSKLCVAWNDSDRTVRIWNLNNTPPRELAVLKDFKQRPIAAVHAKSMKLATVYADVLRLFDLAAGEPKELPTTEFPQKIAIGCLAFSPDGKLALGYASDPQVWDLNGPQPQLSRKIGKVHATAEFHVWSLSFPPDGKSLIMGWMIFGASGMGFSIVDLTLPNSSLRPYPVPNTTPFNVHLTALSADGKLLARISGNYLFLLDNSGPTLVERGRRKGSMNVGYFLFFPDCPDGIVFSPDNSKLFCRDSCATAIWDLTGLEPKQSVLQRVGTPYNSWGSIALSSDGKLLVNRMYEPLIGIDRSQAWDVSGADPLFIQETGAFDYGPTVFARSSHKVLFGNLRSGAVQIWDISRDVNSKPKLTTFQALSKGITQLEISGDDKVLACFHPGNENLVQLWDVSGPEPQKGGVLKVPDKQPIQRIALAPDGKTLALHVSGQGWLYDLSEKEPRRRAVLTYPELPAELAAGEGKFRPSYWAFAPDSKTLASIDAGTHKVALWNSGDGKKSAEWKLPGPSVSLAFSSDSRYLAVANANGTTYILRLESTK